MSWSDAWRELKREAGWGELTRQRTSSTTCDDANDSLVSPAKRKVRPNYEFDPECRYCKGICPRREVSEPGGSVGPAGNTACVEGNNVTTHPGSLTSQWDADYIRWLSDPDITLGKALRLEIAQRLRELTASGR